MKQYIHGLKRSLHFIRISQKGIFRVLVLFSVILTVRSYFDLYFLQRTTQCAEDLFLGKAGMSDVYPVLLLWLCIGLLFAGWGQMTAYVKEKFRLRLGCAYDTGLIQSASEKTAEYYEHYENNRMVLNARDKGRETLLNYIPPRF